VTAIEKLELMLANDKEPILEPDVIAQLLEDHRTVDSEGFYPYETEWTPTYKLNAAAAAGWELKATRVATDYNIQLEGRTMNRGEMMENFLRLARQFRRRAGVTSIALGEVPEPWQLPTA
jgi:hypothetical protein